MHQVRRVTTNFETRLQYRPHSARHRGYRPFPPHFAQRREHAEFESASAVWDGVVDLNPRSRTMVSLAPIAGRDTAGEKQHFYQKF